jgi:hypothetical protein
MSISSSENPLNPLQAHGCGPAALALALETPKIGRMCHPIGFGFLPIGVVLE